MVNEIQEDKKPNNTDLKPPPPPPATMANQEHNHHLLNKPTNPRKLTLIPLIFLIYFEVSGGPFGEEPAVQAAGPLLAILGFLVFPFIWSIPEALITAELATAYPGNGGYVIWASQAFGPFWGFLMGWWKYLSGVINNAAYPVLCVDYLKLIFPIFSHGIYRYLAISCSTVLLGFLNYTGLTIVGWTAVCLGSVSLFPFVLMALISLPKIKPHRWIEWGEGKKDWNLFFNTLFWNLNFWDNASTMAGEVDHPQKTFPKALFSAGILTCLGYLIPLLAGIGALDVKQGDWDDGFLANAAGMIAGKWLKFWVELGAVLSAIGLFEAQLSTCAFQILGMAELGFLPGFLGKRSEWFNTPSLGVLISTLGSLALSFMDFTDIISSANFLYSCGMLLEFATFLWLRKKFPELQRPYRIPLGIPALVCLCLVPAGFLVFVMAISTKMVFVIGGAISVAGIAAYFALNSCKSRQWLTFNKNLDQVVQEEKGEA